MVARMKDIARDLGVSVVTVSKALRNHDDISDETRERVLKRVKELDYRPNLAARSLVTGKSYMMGLVVPDLVHPFFAQVAKGVSRTLRTKGYSLIVASSEEDGDLERQEIDQMLSRSLDLLLIASAQSDIRTFRMIEEKQTPYIMIDRTLPDLKANFVGTNDRAIGQLATEHLIENGCREIAYIGGRQASPAVDRLYGYQQTMKKAGLEIRPEFVVQNAHGDESGDVIGYQSMRELLRSPRRPDGLFCSNDPTAMGAMRAILDAGIRIPEEIALIGCGNVPYAPMLRVPLSTIDQGSEAMGERAAKLALSLLERKETPKPKTLLMTPKLVARESSARRLNN